jgi:hypothetical protein
VLGFQDEVWWSRFAQPKRALWTDQNRPQTEKPQWQSGDQDPKALACYGLLRQDNGEMLLRFVQGRPVSAVTCEFLQWVTQELGKQGKKALLLVWDNASWHISKQVTSWIKQHNRKAKKAGGVRILSCFLPKRSPWLNPIEPKWLHGKRAVMPAQGLLSAEELESRVCAYYGCPKLDPLAQPLS